MLEPAQAVIVHVGRRGPAHEAVDLVTLTEQELGEIRAVLARDAGDESLFHVVSWIPRDRFSWMRPWGGWGFEGF